MLPACRSRTRNRCPQDDLAEIVAELSLKTRARKITEELFRLYPEPECALTHQDAFQLAVATILSAQCTDERVNMVTPVLFKKYPTPQKLAGAAQEDIQEIIKSTGFFRNKAKNILGFARAIVTEFGGAVPQELEELIKLPGIGRKTANVVLGTAFGIASGVVVDTHVTRLSNRMGLTESGDAVKIERDLMALLPQDNWINFSHAMIWHGRRVCNARKPDCGRCTLAKLCPKIGAA
ncbi:MAG: endonuclease III [Calditrichaeota bacterium]|nr:endonuclease III [Calditrichota bacterium]